MESTLTETGTVHANWDADPQAGAVADVRAETQRQTEVLDAVLAEIQAAVAKLRGGACTLTVRHAAGERPASLDPGCALIHAERLIYRYDGDGRPIALREGRYEPGLIQDAGDVDDINAAHVAPGTFVTCRKLGLFRLGAAPFGRMAVVAAEPAPPAAAKPRYDPRVIAARKAIAETPYIECRDWQDGRCALAGSAADPTSESACWCFEKAQRAVNAIGAISEPRSTTPD